MRVRPAVWLVAAVVATLDQLAKAWALDALAFHRRIDIFDHYLGLELAYNSGAALSLFDKATWFVTGVMVVVLVYLVWNHGRAKGGLGLTIFGLGLGGAIGNLADRFFRSPGWGRGHVVDMISYYTWFVGNVADIAIVIAAALALIAVWRGRFILEAPPIEAPPDVDPDDEWD